MTCSATCTVGVIALLVSTIGAPLSAAVEPPNPKDLTQGTWTLNLSKSKFCGTPPRGGGRVIEDVGWGMIAVTQMSVNASGLPSGDRVSYVLRYDGEKYPSTINGPANESITWKLVNPRRVEFAHWSKQDKITSEYVRTVTDDGQTMTQTTKRVGQECMDSQVFDRTAAAPRASRP